MLIRQLTTDVLALLETAPAVAAPASASVEQLCDTLLARLSDDRPLHFAGARRDGSSPR